MAGEFRNLGDALKKLITPKSLEEQLQKESVMMRKLREQQVEMNKKFAALPMQPMRPMHPGRSIAMPKTGEHIVSVDTPDGPVVFDFVDSVNYLDSGALEVNVLHDGNRTSEVFPDGKWDHCTTKTIAIEDEKSDEEKASLIEQVMSKPSIFKADLNISDELLKYYEEAYK